MQCCHVVICLGQSLLEGGRVPVILELRVAHAVAVYRRLASKAGGASLYVSGNDVAGRGRFKPEGRVMFELLQRQGVDAEHIDVDTEAFNTIENALNALAPIRKRGAVAVTLVTSDFHSPRAEYIFKTVFASKGVEDLVFSVDPAASGLDGGALRPRRERPEEINDWNFLERVEHEFSLMQSRMVPWLQQYRCTSRQSDVDQALSSLKQLAVSPGAKERGEGCTTAPAGDAPWSDSRLPEQQT